MFHRKSIGRFQQITPKMIALMVLVGMAVGFVAGVLLLRNGVIKATYYSLKDVPLALISKLNKIETYWRGNESIPTVILSINYKQQSKILNSRSRGIQDGHNIYTDADWAKGKLETSEDNKRFKVGIRLKGTMPDNWDSSDGAWSFRVKVKNGDRYNGMREFALFKPKVASGILELLFQTASAKAGLIALRTEIVNLRVNGKELGKYYLQEHFDKILVESNKRREGPIIGFDKSRVVQSWSHDPLNILEIDHFKTSDIVVTGNLKKKTDAQRRLSAVAKNQLELWRRGELAGADVFDVDKMGKFLAIRALIGSSDLDWKDIKFYYNVLSGRFEPIPREAHADYDIHDWWYRGQRPFNDVRYDDFTSFEDLIFADDAVYKSYITNLKHYSENRLLESLLHEQKEFFDPLIGLLAEEGEATKWLDVLRRRSEKIRLALSHPSSVSFLIDDKGILHIKNVQGFPISIKRVVFQAGDGSSVSIQTNPNKSIAAGTVNGEEYFTTEIRVCGQLLQPQHCVDNSPSALESAVFHYSIQHLDEHEKSAKVTFVPTATIDDLTSTTPLEQLFEIVKGTVRPKVRNLTIKSPVEIPSNYQLYVPAGHSITFMENGQLTARGGVFFDGSAVNPVVVKAEEDAKSGGILITGKGKGSLIRHTHFYALPGFYQDDLLITGCVNVYDTALEMSQVKIFANTFPNGKTSNWLNKDDFLNFVSSKIKVDDLEITGASSDAIDIDFSDGSMSGIKIIRSGNDGLDLSFSDITVLGAQIIGSGDKGISVGEKTNFYGEEIVIEQSKIGLAVKDGSNVKINRMSAQQNLIDLAAYRKKNEYRLPSLQLVNFEETGVKYLIEHGSKVLVNGVVKSGNTPDVIAAIEQMAKDR